MSESAPANNVQQCQTNIQQWACGGLQQDVKISLISFHFVFVMKGVDSHYYEAFLVDSNHCV